MHRRLTDTQTWMLMVSSLMILGGISIYVNHSDISNYSKQLVENQERGDDIVREVFKQLHENNLNTNLTREQSKATYDLVNEYLLNATVVNTNNSSIGDSMK